MNTRLENITLGVQEIMEHDGLGTDVFQCLALCTTNEIRKGDLNFLFDICRLQVKDEDVEVVHRSIAKHHLFFTKRPL